MSDEELLWYPLHWRDRLTLLLLLLLRSPFMRCRLSVKVCARLGVKHRMLDEIDPIPVSLFWLFSLLAGFLMTGNLVVLAAQFAVFLIFWAVNGQRRWRYLRFEMDWLKTFWRQYR